MGTVPVPRPGGGNGTVPVPRPVGGNAGGLVTSLAGAIGGGRWLPRPTLGAAAPAFAFGRANRPTVRGAASGAAAIGPSADASGTDRRPVERACATIWPVTLPGASDSAAGVETSSALAT